MRARTRETQPDVVFRSNNQEEDSDDDTGAQGRGKAIGSTMDGFSLDFRYHALAPALVSPASSLSARRLCTTLVHLALTDFLPGQILAGLGCMATAYYVSSLLANLLERRA